MAQLALAEAPRGLATDIGRQLYGDFDASGAGIRWYDFESPHVFDWSRGFHSDSLALCVNLAGRGFIRHGKNSFDIEACSAAMLLPDARPGASRRMPRERHRFLIIDFSRPFLRQRLADRDGALAPMVEAFLQGDAPAGRIGGVHRLTAVQEQRAGDLLNPPVLQAARPVWYEAKILEWMADFFFERQGEDELFCDRQKRLARERVEKVGAILRKRLDAPLSLKEIAREAGCSPFHLSRTFSAETGMTISQYLRKLRMERAAELLRSGKYNVTETALAVGYSSMSHFSQAFCETMGCCPGLYPLKSGFK